MAATKTFQNIFLATCLASASLGGAAQASGPAVPADPVVTYEPAAPVQDWAGFYGGIQLGSTGGNARSNASPTAFRFNRDTSFGLFAGYNWQHGNFVYGGEVNYLSFNSPLVSQPSVAQNDALELRARAGYAFDNVLVYGFVGAARSSIGNASISVSQNGYSYGLGAQYQFANGFMTGLEFARRDVSGTVGPLTVNSQIDTVSLRFGVQF